MKVLITNDDGVHSQGIIQLAMVARKHCSDVFVVSPSVEQSGVSSAITFLRPLFPKALGGLDDSQDAGIPGFSLNGTPVDCVRLGLHELCPFRPDVILSGINDGLNAGPNVNFSGTVGGAMAGAAFGIPSIAISLESSSLMDFGKAAELAWPIVEQCASISVPTGSFFNLNFPTAGCRSDAEIRVVPVETNPMGYDFDHGHDPKNRRYFWATNNPGPQPSPFLTDTQALLEGHITISTLSSNLNCVDARSSLQHAFDSTVES
ncbi:MAG: 5'/3'-nucleotidase SurE [Planctomycetota bacterium]